jgi:hypothetical protein
MSYYPKSYLEFENAANLAIDAKEIRITYPTLNDVPDELKRGDYLIFISSANSYYRWDENILDWAVVIPDATDTILSASNVGTGNGIFKQEVTNNLEFKSLKGTTDQINITSNTNDLTLSLPQSIATTSSPSFVNVTSSNPATSANHLLRKAEFDAGQLLDLKIANNLSDVTPSTARTNIDVYSKNETDTAIGAVQTNLTSHINQTTGAHSGSAISTVAGTNTYATTTNVQGDINALDAGIVAVINQKGAANGIVPLNALSKIDSIYTDSVISVTGGSNINISGTAQLPVVNLNSTLTGLTSVSTGSIATTTGTITTAPSGANDIVNKTYADSKVNSVTSGNSNIQIFGVSANPIVTLQDDLLGLTSVVTGILNTTSGSITTAPTTANHITNKLYVDTQVGNLGTTALLKANNLNDVVSVPNSRQNLGLGDNLSIVDGDILVGDSVTQTYDRVQLLPTANQTTVTTGPGILQIGTVQNIDTNSQPTFNRSFSTLAPNTGNANTNKTYVDGLDATNVKSVTTSNENLISIGGTAQNPIITPQIGGGEPLLYNFTTSANPGVNELTVSTPANFVTATNIRIRYTAINRSDDDFVRVYLQLLKDSCPFEFTLVQDNNVGNYATFYATSLTSVGPNFIEFVCQYDATDSTVTTFANNLPIKLMITNIQRTMGAGGGISITSSLPKTLIITNTGVNTLTSGNSNIVIGGTTTARTVTLASSLSALTGVTTTSLSTTSGSITTAPTTNFNIANKLYVDRADRNLLSNVNLHVFTFPASLLTPATYTLSANESLTLNLTSAVNTTTNYLVSLKGHGFPQRATHHTSGTVREILFGVKLTGASWTGASLDRCRIGFATEAWFNEIENNITSQNGLIGPKWDFNATSGTKGYTSGFLGTQGFINYNDAGNVVTRSGYTTDSIAAQNDILIASFDFQGASNNIITYWYRGPAPRANLFGPLPSGNRTTSNFVASNINPLISLQNTGPGYDIQILSERQLTVEGITFANRPSYFH